MIPKHPAESHLGEVAESESEPAPSPTPADPTVVVPVRATSSVAREIEDAAWQVLRSIGDLSDEQRRMLSAQVAQISLQHLTFEHGCPIHSGSIHGEEAEELRSGIERLLGESAPSASPWVSDPEHEDMQDLRFELQALLDDVNARDSLAHLDRPPHPDAPHLSPEASPPSPNLGALDKYVRTLDEELRFAEEEAMSQAALAIADLIDHASITQLQIAGCAEISADQLAQILCADGDPTLRAIARIGRAAGRRMQISFGTTPTGSEASASHASPDADAPAAAAGDPTADDPTADDPTADDPTADDPTAEGPAIDAPAPDPWLALPIEHLELPGRALNTLARHHIRTIGDLTRQRADDLTRLAGGGPRLVASASEALERLGLSLAQASGPTDALRQIARLVDFARFIDFVPDAPIGPSEADQIVRATRDRLAHARWEVEHLTQGLLHAQLVARDLAFAIAADPSATQATRAHAGVSLTRLETGVPSPTPLRADATSVAHLDLSLRTQQFLTTQGIQTIAHLAEHSEADLRKMGAVQYVIRQIRQGMQQVGRSLRASQHTAAPRSPRPTKTRSMKTRKTMEISPNPRGKAKAGSASARSGLGSVGRRNARRGDA